MKTRRLWTTGLVVLLAAAAGAIVATGDRTDGTDPAPAPAAPRSSRIETSSVALDDQPYALFAEGRTVWVSGGRGHVLEVRDRQVGSYPHPTGPLGITVVDGRVWTTAAPESRDRAAEVIVLDAGTGEVVRSIPLPGDSPYGIDHSRRGVFVALHDGELLRIDQRGEPTTRTRLGDRLTQVLATREAVWVSQPAAGVVWRVELERGQFVKRAVSFGGPGSRSCPQGSDAGKQMIFVADPCAGNLWLLDPHTGEITGAVSRAGRRPVDVAVDDGLVYVVCMADDEVTVLEEATRDEVATARAGQGAISVVAVSGVAWVANMDDSTLTRIEVKRSR